MNRGVKKDPLAPNSVHGLNSWRESLIEARFIRKTFARGPVEKKSFGIDNKDPFLFEKVSSAVSVVFAYCIIFIRTRKGFHHISRKTRLDATSENVNNNTHKNASSPKTMNIDSWCSNSTANWIRGKMMIDFTCCGTCCLRHCSRGNRRRRLRRLLSWRTASSGREWASRGGWGLDGLRAGPGEDCLPGLCTRCSAI